MPEQSVVLGLVKKKKKEKKRWAPVKMTLCAYRLKIIPRFCKYDGTYDSNDVFYLKGIADDLQRLVFITTYVIPSPGK